ncbi:MAG: CocE/NonD family hydrolase, partial [Steroidobacteraceae bacterium]
MSKTQRLEEISLGLQRILKRSMMITPPRFAVSEIRCETIRVAMRDGVRLATDIYLPPLPSAPAIAVRTPYSRGMDAYAGLFLSFARRGYAVVSQDCRGTGDSEPDYWDYYLYEPEDGHDLVEWISGQPWFDGFLGSCGGSYVGQTQWQMAMHPKMSTIVPDVSGLGVAVNTVHLHMFCNAYARTVGKGDAKLSVPYFELEGQMLEETWATGYFNEPLCRPLPVGVLARFPQLRGLSGGDAQRWLWEHYCSLTCAGRAQLVKEILGTETVSILEVEALSNVFGQRISHDAHTLPHPRPMELIRAMHAPALMRTGWYDWGLNDALATWHLLMRAAPDAMRSRCKLIIAPSAHNMPGYHEGLGEHPELHHAYGAPTSVELLLHWYAAVREGKTDAWPTVTYYLMGANEWCGADAW